MKPRSDIDDQSNEHAEGNFLPSDNPLQNPNNPKEWPDQFYRTGRQKSRVKKIGAMQMTPLQDKLLGCARIMPKQHTQDIQWLYSENIKLKQKLRQLAEQNTRLKTRISISQKEKQQLFVQADLLANSTDMVPLSRAGLRNKSHHQSSKNSISIKPGNIAARRMFRDAKEQIEKLKNQSNRVKKSIKYTQINELQIENENLLEETSRLQRYIQELNSQDNYQQYEQAIEELQRKLQQEKQTNKAFPSQLRRKDDEIEELKQKVRDLQNKKNDNQNRLNRQITHLKGQVTSLRKSSSQIRDFKDKTVQKHSVNKPGVCYECIKLNEDKKMLQKKINIMEKETRGQKTRKKYEGGHSEKSKGSVEFERSFDKSRQQKRASITTNQMQPPYNSRSPKIEKPIKQLSSNKLENPEPKQKVTEIVNKNIKTKDKKQQPNGNLEIGSSSKVIAEKKVSIPQKNNAQPEKEQSQGEKYEEENEEYAEQDFQQTQDKAIQKKQSKKKSEQKQEQQVQEQEYGDDQFGEQLPDQESPQKSQKNPKSSQSNRPKAHANRPENKKNDRRPSEKDLLENSLGKDENDNSEEEVLFQKQQKLTKKKQKKDKVNKVLKETITYKFMAQRYAYKDFEEDLKNSGASTFSVEDIASMLSNEPFFLNQEQQQFMLIHCFGTTDLQVTDVLPLKTFLKKTKLYIGDFQLISEQEEQKLWKTVAQKVIGEQKSIIKKLQKSENQTGLVSKKTFVKSLNQVKLTDNRAIQYCLSEISVISPDIDHLNYVEFFEKFQKGIGKQ